MRLLLAVCLALHPIAPNVLTALMTLDDERTDRSTLTLGVLRLTDRMQVRLGQQDPNPAAALEAVAA